MNDDPEYPWYNVELAYTRNGCREIRVFRICFLVDGVFPISMLTIEKDGKETRNPEYHDSTYLPFGSMAVRGFVEDITRVLKDGGVLPMDVEEVKEILDDIEEYSQDKDD